MPTDLWDAKQYLSFADQRLRPFLDLVDRAEATGFRNTAPRRVVDLGCGPGNATALLAERWPQAHVVGVDSSPAMIEDAATRRIPGRLEFKLGDLREWRPGEWQPGYLRDQRPGDLRYRRDQRPGDGRPDLILANAVFQWVPGHLNVLTRLAGLVAAGGTLAMQVPGNFGAPTHTLLADLTRTARWRDLIPVGLAQPGSYEPEAYLDTLERAGLAPDVWESTYLYLVDGPTGVTDFVRGSALRPITTHLSPADAIDFTAEYQALIVNAYPPREINGRITQVLPYRRIFAIGQRP
jgi:trans-aconitate 2-methyltransferase